MSIFHIFDCGRPEEKAGWLAAWQAWPEREPAGHPDYAALFARPGDRVVCAAQSCDGHGSGVLFPLIVRPLRNEPWGQTVDEACDLVSPYGYGGPFTWGQADAAEFWAGFESWTSRIHAVSLFARLSLFPEQLLPETSMPLLLEVNTSNVVRPLIGTVDAIWMDYEHKVRKNVNKARRNELTIVNDGGERLEEFLAIYYGTMERREASAGFYFSRGFFETIVREIPGGFRFFHCLKDGKMVSTEMVLVSNQHLYSFLGGTIAEAFEWRPNDLLKHAVVEWGLAQGKRAFVLGGGYGGEDGIFRYKQSFAPQGIVPFKVAKKIYDAALCDKLVVQRRELETGAGREWLPGEGFFPPYRA
jgi:hypothetical protein